MNQRKGLNDILYLSTYPPRECGIASFTKDLADAVNKRFYPALSPAIASINEESTDIYNYDKSVIYQIARTSIDDYIKLAKKINKNDQIKLVHIQHEFGIFGGDYGNYLIPFFQVIEKPVVVTFHSVLSDQDEERKRIVESIGDGAKALVVMDELSKKILEKDYGIKESKIFIIPHGIPETTFNETEKEKEKLGLSGKIVLHSHGLLSRGKGIEYVIRALPKVVEKYPNLIYLVIGQTHPVIRKREGEKYRNYLKSEAERLGLKDNVKFYNKYIPLDELISYIKASDICICANLEEKQAASGVLSRMMGCGRPVISTKFAHAKGLVTPGKGMLVRFKNSGDITNSLLEMLHDPKKLYEMGRVAYIETRFMTWSNVAFAHLNLYRKYIVVEKKKAKFPPIILKHFRTLTNDFGIIQFAKNNKPDIFYGYSIDDNARAMIASAMFWKKTKNKQALELLNIYLAFIKNSQRKNGSFVNIFDKDRKETRKDVSEDSQGRTVWALGYIISQNDLPSVIRNEAKIIFKKAIPKIRLIKSPRTVAFIMIGLYFYLQTYPKSHCRQIFNRFAQRQLDVFSRCSSRDWAWFEKELSYSNSKLPESLFYAYLLTKKEKCLEAAKKSLDFLLDITFEGGYFSPIGQNGWYFKGGKRTYFDQQPEEVSSMVQTLVLAYQITKKDTYKKRGFAVFEWFLGKNHLKQMMYNANTGGCYDGLGRYTVNINQGAESTISYLLARLEIEDFFKKTIKSKKVKK